MGGKFVRENRSIGRVVQVYVSPRCGSQFLFILTQGVALLRIACPGLGMSRPVGAHFDNSHENACHMGFEYESVKKRVSFQGGFADKKPQKPTSSPMNYEC
jgi:hypothetical protein